MEIQGGGGAPYIQVAYQPTAFNQAGQLANQMGQLNLQDPAFLQELQRLEQPHQLQQHQLIQQPVQQLQAVPAYNTGGPGNHLPPPTTSPGHTSAKTRNHEEVGELAPEEVRWFYKKEADKPWIVFDGYDSLRIEIRYRHIWQTRWRSQNMGHGRRAQSLNRYYDRSAGESYSGSSDEDNFSDPSQQYSRQQTFNSHPPRYNFIICHWWRLTWSNQPVAPPMSVCSHNSAGRGAIKQSRLLALFDPSSIIFFLQEKLPPSSPPPAPPNHFHFAGESSLRPSQPGTGRSASDITGRRS